MSTLTNIKKRFRQGRTTYTKLKAAKKEAITAHVARMKEISDDVQARLNEAKAILQSAEEVVEPHIHDENCRHFIKYGDVEHNDVPAVVETDVHDE